MISVSPKEPRMKTTPPTVSVIIHSLKINIFEASRDTPPPGSDDTLGDIKKELDQMNAGFQHLSTVVADLPTVEAGVQVTLQHLADQIKALGDAPTSDQLEELASQIEQFKGQIATDISNNTQAAGEAPVPPEDIPTVPVPTEEQPQG